MIAPGRMLAGLRNCYKTMLKSVKEAKLTNFTPSKPLYQF